MRVPAVSDRAIIPVEGVVWRSCTFATGPAARLVHAHGGGAHGGGPLVIDLPPDLVPAVPARRSEFLAGRLCAALALLEAGVPPQVPRRGRAPVWPAGIAGSISHAGGRAMAVVSRRPAIGVDCERLMGARTLAEVAPLVLTAGDWRRQPAGMDDATFATLVFSAKEAAYKAISARIADLPEFREAEVEGVTGSGLMLRFRDWRIPVHHARDGAEVVTLACPD